MPHLLLALLLGDLAAESAGAGSFGIVRRDSSLRAETPPPCVLRGWLWVGDSFTGEGSPDIEIRPLLAIDGNAYEGEAQKPSASIAATGAYEALITSRFPVRVTVKHWGFQSASVDLGSCGLSVNFVLSPATHSEQELTFSKPWTVVFASSRTTGCRIEGRVLPIPPEGHVSNPFFHAYALGRPPAFIVDDVSFSEPFQVNAERSAIVLPAEWDTFVLDIWPSVRCAPITIGSCDLDVDFHAIPLW